MPFIALLLGLGTRRLRYQQRRNDEQALKKSGDARAVEKCQAALDELLHRGSAMSCTGLCHSQAMGRRAILRLAGKVQAIMEELRASSAYEYINMLGRYSFAVHDSVARGELRLLRSPPQNP